MKSGIGWSSWGRKGVVSQIADALGESPDEPCRLWTFRGESGSFSVFEMEHSQRIGGCLFREANNDNDSHETKPA